MKKIDKKTLKQIGKSIKNLKTNKVSGPIDVAGVNKVSHDFENNEKPLINIFSIVDQSDGSAIMDYEVNDAFIKFYLKDTGKKRFTITGFNNWMINILKERLKNEKTIQKARKS